MSSEVEHYIANSYIFSQTSPFRKRFFAGIENVLTTARFSAISHISMTSIDAPTGEPRLLTDEYSRAQKNILEQAKVMADDMSRKAYWRDIKAEWTLLAMVLDRLFLILYSILVITFVAGIVIRLNSSYDIEDIMT